MPFAAYQKGEEEGNVRNAVCARAYLIIRKKKDIYRGTIPTILRAVIVSRVIAIIFLPCAFARGERRERERVRRGGKPPLSSSIRQMLPRGKTTSIAPAISRGSNFRVSSGRNAKSTLKNRAGRARSVRLGSLGKSNRATRACKSIRQFHGAAAPKNGVGKIAGPFFRRKSYDFRPTVGAPGYPPFRLVANFDPPIIDRAGSSRDGRK